MSDTTPVVIGLSSYLEDGVRMGIWDRAAAALPRVYTDAALATGAAIVLLPPQPPTDAAVDAVLAGLDGLIITGGKDVDAALYGQDAHAENDAPRRDRDEWEIALVRGAIRHDLPFLGICRGMQVLNVALGGTLIQHLPDVIGTSRYSNGDATFADNPARTVPGTLAANILGEELTVKSYHHQALDRVADGLTVSAWGEHEVIQAVDIEGMSFGLAVQWHPEESPEDARLFRALTEAATAAQERAASTR